jgi:hypothetical protein
MGKRKEREALLEEEVKSLKIAISRLQAQNTTKYNNHEPSLKGKKMKKPRWALRIVIIMVFMVGASGVAYTVSPEIQIRVVEFLQQFRINPEPQPSPVATASTSGTARNFYRVARQCPTSPYAEVQDDGLTLVLRGYGENVPFQLSFEEMKCFFRAVAMPEYIQEEMLRTRAIDGTVRATFIAITASWTYHPDDGLFVILHSDKGE